LTPGSSYRFKIYYTNPTSAAEDVSIDGIYLSNLHLNAAGPVLKNDFKAKIYADKNCSGTIDKGEDLFSYTGENGILEEGGSVALTPDIQDQTSTAPALGTLCYIADIFIPDNSSLISGDVLFESSADFAVVLRNGCNAGGRVINPVGDVKTKIGTSGLSFTSSENSSHLIVPNNNIIKVYPNPNTGSFKIYLRGNGSNKLILYDVYGRIVQQRSSDNSNIIEMHSVQPGIYFLKVVFENGKATTKKIIVQ